MACFFFDLDGVVFEYETLIPLEGAVECINRLKNEGHQIIITTARKVNYVSRPDISIEATRQKLIEIGVKFDSIIPEVCSPRIVINDEGAYAINHPKNKPLIYEEIFPQGDRQKDSFDLKIWQRVVNAFNANGWYAYRYAGDYLFDADDYVQTMIISKSLIASKGFNHQDIVSRLKQKPGYRTPRGVELMAGGYQPGYLESSDPRNKNAIWFLSRSNEKLYLAKSGLTDGAAMRVAGIAAYYTESFEKMVEVVNNISRITHSFAEARIAAILVAIRFHDIFNGIDN